MDKVYKLFDIDIAVGSREELYERCAALIGCGGAISTVNPEILATAESSEELKAALSASLCIPDGIGVELALRRLGCKTERLPGVELGEELLESGCVKLGIIGGREGVADKAMQMLVMKHKDVIPEFALSGYGIDYEHVGRLLDEKRPDIVFVCLGSPKQELFIKEMRKYSDKTLFVALGGSVDIYSGEKKRAPLFFRALGAEWIWRILSEPKRLSRLPKLLYFVKKTPKSLENRSK